MGLPLFYLFSLITVPCMYAMSISMTPMLFYMYIPSFLSARFCGNVIASPSFASVSPRLSFASAACLTFGGRVTCRTTLHYVRQLVHMYKYPSCTCAVVCVIVHDRFAPCSIDCSALHSCCSSSFFCIFGLCSCDRLQTCAPRDQSIVSKTLDSTCS